MKHSLLKENIVIKPIKEKAYKIAGNAKTGKDTYLAIQYMLQAIDDKHAFFMPAEIRKQWEGDETSNKISGIQYSKNEIKNGFAYINLPGFHGNDPTLKVAFADTLQKQIKELNNKKVKGWIVDLRNNDGGNMEPMLAGLEPLFSSDTLGFLIDSNGEKEYWGRGTSFKEKYTHDYLQSNIKNKRIKNLPIAVLYGNRTGSSGEIIIISFIHNSNTKSFGQPSYGLTTGNGEFRLADGSYMFFSSTYMADRNGKIYKSNVIPDELIKENKNSEDETLNAAIKWLQAQQ